MSTGKAVNKLTEGALFAGVMGFGLGFRRAGFQNLWAVEKDSFCQSVIRTQFPETELFTDVRECGKHNLKPVDVITAGFPCQDLSVAGKRAGLAGSRSGLFWELHRILGELRPAWFVIENVPGLFSSNEGRDFAVVLDALDELGYGLAWRVLNSQFFGVAQRRRRVFIVGRAGEPCPREVLFEPESGQGDIETGGEERAGAAGEVAGSFGGSGKSGGFLPNAEQAADGYLQVAAIREQTDALCATYGTKWNGNASAENGSLFALAHAIPARAGHHGHSSPRGDGSDNTCDPQDEGRLRRGRQGSTDERQEPYPGASERPDIVLAIRLAHQGANGQGMLSDGTCHTIDNRGEAVAFAENQRGEIRTSDIAPQLSTGGGKPGSGYSAVAFHENKSGNLAADGNARALRSGASHSHQFVNSLSPVGGGPDDNDAQPGHLVSEATYPDRVRATPGIPETLDYPKGLDSARYRSLGNAVTASVSFWIAKRILLAGGD